MICFELNDHLETKTDILFFIKRRENEGLIEMETETGERIKVTKDHPILTPTGMREAERLKAGDRIAIYHFSGVDYEKPSNKKILEEKKLPNSVKQELQKRNLLPLTLAHEKIGIITKLFGYILGDGYIYEVKEKMKRRKKLRKRLITCILGQKEDLEQIRADIKELGFKASRVYERRKIKGKNSYGEFKTIGYECMIRITANSFSWLFHLLGIPIGSKIKGVKVPSWIMQAPLWIKRNFLAGLFGAELTKPSTIKNHPFTFSQPMLTIRIRKGYEKKGKSFLLQISNLLNQFGVRVNCIKIRSKNTVGLTLVISNTSENLINLYSKIGYEYNRERRLLSLFAIAYLKLKIKKKGLLKVRNKKINFPTFEEFVKKNLKECGKTGFVFEKIIEKKKIPYKGFVYDFTVLHPDHNFVANNVVVSNCGVRLLRTNLTEDQIRPKLKQLLEEIFRNVPSGVGRGGKIRLSISQLDEVLELGAKWAVEHGYGTERDLEFLEENGQMKQADAAKVSSKAKRRGAPQLGSLGAGNHFLEIQKVDKIYLPEVAKIFGIVEKGQVCVMVHTGSRGLGHQVCTDYLRILEHAFREELRKLPDRELVFAPAGTKQCEDYFKAMCCAANFAWCNRQAITHWVRESMVKVLGMKEEDIGLEVVYDVAHNIGKIEVHEIDGEKKKVYIHRKGATRAFPAGSKEIPKEYIDVGQPVLIPGAMASASYVLVAGKGSKDTFYSTAHGAGRVLSRTKALKIFRGERIAREMERGGILVRAASWKVLAEEATQVYKEIDEVALVTEKAGISNRVVRLVPIGVVKG